MYDYLVRQRAKAFSDMSIMRLEILTGNRIIIIIIIIKGHSLRRACLQPATNTQNSKPRPPTTNAKEN